MTTSARPNKLVLLPRSKPLEVEDASAKNASIFGTGKPRDINKPEIKQLEERLDQTLVISKQQTAAALSEEQKQKNSSKNSANQNDNSGNEGGDTDRLRTTSTTSSNVSK